MDLFLTNTQFSLQKVLIDWNHVDYCDVFNQLFGLTAPIHYRGPIVEQVM